LKSNSFVMLLLGKLNKDSTCRDCYIAAFRSYGLSYFSGEN
jgi:hypothetical protein